ncbi:glutamate-1-semialdehyde 2,1-aminomutase [Enhydrobacter aerosaccus]|uniref:Glutamate-1-semialdehyde 2,1-aminomutase n=2 Tax=Enhydrobacter aerosaccus TaxID=225324 RepID=A0A1T4JKZ6_9HYPH|nr:glutamate-1-semialdehyde 2,1-aminomutase [Enhydrobacter aerosaccus]
MPRWPDPDTKSRSLYDRALNVLPGGVTRVAPWQPPYPVYAQSCKGAWITDVDGNQIFDLINNFASLIHGHAHPAIIDAVTAQLSHGTACTMPTEREVALAELLCERVPAFDKVRFCNSGTEAVMLAVKAARAFTGRPALAKVEGAYHGTYDHVEVSLDSRPENWGNDPNPVAFVAGTPKAVLDDTVILPFNQPEAAARIIREQGARLAAVLIDLMPIYTGCVPATPEFLKAITEAARATGAIVILDEVISFRFGYSGGQGVFGIEPDLTTLAKIIGGGFPVGAVAGKEKIMAVFDHRSGKPAVASTGTFTANMVTMTAGLVGMELMTEEAFDRLNALGDRTRSKLSDAVRRSQYPAQITGHGSIFKIHTHSRPVNDYRSAWSTPEELADLAALQAGLLRRGFLISTKGNGFLSTVMTEAELDSFVDAVEGELRILATQRLLA